MPLALITNRVATQFTVPPPVARTLGPHGSVSVVLTSAQLQDPALTPLIERGLITVTVQDDPNESAAIEGFTLGVPTAGVVTTTDATVTTVLTIPVALATTAGVLVRCTARYQGGSEGASYTSAATFRNDAGVVTQIGTTTAVSVHRDIAGWVLTFAISGTNVLVQVTGEVAKTIVWKAGALVQSEA